MPIITLGRLGAATAVLLPSSVLYASYNKPEQRHGEPVKISELPIYSVPKESVLFIDEKPDAVQNTVSEIRKFLWPYIESTQETTVKVKEKTDKGVAYVKETVTYIQETEGVVPKISVIAVSGLAGIVLGYRGGILRKATFGSVAMVTAAAMCFPKETVEITQDGYERLKTAAKDAGILPKSDGKKDK